MKLYKTYNCAGELQGYFCEELGDVTLDECTPCEDDEICEGYNPACQMLQDLNQEDLKEDSEEEINSTQEEISNYTPPPLPPGYEDFLKNQEDSEG